MFHRVRNGYRGITTSSAAASAGNAIEDKRAPSSSSARLAPLRSNASMSAGASGFGRRSQWWHGVLVGAVLTMVLFAGGTAWLGVTIGPRDEVEETVQDRQQEKCPVYNAVTGETTMPGDHPPKREKRPISPGHRYPIDSNDRAERVHHAKVFRSSGPKGALPDEVGRSSLSKRLAKSSAAGHTTTTAMGKNSTKKREGISAALTLLKADASNPELFISALGGSGRSAGDEETWTELFVCEEDARILDGVSASGGRGPWRDLQARGAVKEISCQADRKGTRAGELSLACLAGDVSSPPSPSDSDWIWIPGPALVKALVDQGKQGPAVVPELARLAMSADVDGVFGLHGWIRTYPLSRSRGDHLAGRRRLSGDTTSTSKHEVFPNKTQPLEASSTHADYFHVDGSPSVPRRHLKSVRGSGGKGRAMRESVGAGEAISKKTQGIGDAVMEVDALIDGIFVRGAHLRHACALIRGQSSPENSRGGTEKAAISEFMKLSAISYVLRKSLGVRSFAKSELLPMRGKHWGWSFWKGYTGGGLVETLASDLMSVPGSEFLPWECLGRSSLEAVLFSITGADDLKALKPLFMEFQDSGVYDPFLVLSGRALGHPSELVKELESLGQEQTSGGGVLPGTCGVLELGKAFPFGREEKAHEGSLAVQAEWGSLLSRLSPVAVIAVSSSTARSRDRVSPDGQAGSGDTEGERAARLACADADARTAYILMPQGDVPSASWIATLGPVALASWAQPRFSASVITNDRPGSLKRLLNSLKGARFFGDQVSVDFYVESSADDETLGVAEAFSSEWGDRGLVQTHFRVLKGGLIRAVTESFFPSDRHHHAFLLEDDVEVSPLFYAWAKWATLTYQYGEKSDFMRNMYGVSLYTPRVDELSEKRQVYDSNKLIASMTQGTYFSPYLHQVPCSWGAVFFPETWMEYRLYLAARLQEDHLNVQIKGSKTNNWNTSWKRFYIEMAYQAQYYMLYPNYFNQTSFATNWLEVGEHIKADKSPAEGSEESGGQGGAAPLPPPPASKGDKKHLPKDYTVPLMADGESLVDPLPSRRLPPLKELPRMDILNRGLTKRREK